MSRIRRLETLLIRAFIRRLRGTPERLPGERQKIERGHRPFIRELEY